MSRKAIAVSALLSVACLCAISTAYPQAGYAASLEGGRRFQYSVMTDGDIAVVGAEWFDGFKGAAWILRRHDGKWLVEQRLLPADPGRFDHLGCSVSMSGDYIVVGAAWHNQLRGAAYVFRRAEAGWIEQQKLTAEDAMPDDRIGKFVSIDGDAIDIASGKGDRRRFARAGDRWEERENPAGSIRDGRAMTDNLSSLDDAVVSGLIGSGLLGTDADPPVLPAAPPDALAQVTATNGTLEDRVEIRWTSTGLDAIVYKVLREGELLSIVASDESLYIDTTGELNTTYSYCVVVKNMADEESPPVCADGLRILFPPISVTATDGEFTDRVAVSWVDISKIEEGYYVYRDGERIDSTGAGGSWIFDTTGLPDSVYTYEVRTFAEGEQSVADADSGWRGVLLPPLNVSASDGQYIDRVLITWQDQSDTESGYRIYRGSVPIDSTGAGAGTGSYLAYVDSSVVFGETYEYCVATIDTGDVESIHVCDEGGTGLTPPGNVSASDSTYDDKIRITWEDLDTNENGYEVSRALGPDTVVLDTTGTNVEVYDDLTAIPDTTYTYLVRAVSDLGGVSTAVSDEGFRSVVLAPVNIDATDGEFEDRVDITWESHSKTAVLFKIFRDGIFVKSLSVGNTTYSDHGGTAGHVYDYTIVAATALEAEAAGAPDEGSRELAVPTAVAASDEEYEDKIMISWEDNSNFEHGYTVTRRDTGMAVDDTTFVIGPNRTSMADYNAVPGITYRYSVEAFDSISGEIGYSQEAEDLGLRVLLAPTNVEAGDAEFEEKVEIFWIDNSSAEDGYHIYRDDVLIGETADNFTSYVDTSPVLGASHTYSVAAYDSVFPSQMGESERNSDTGSTTILAPVSFNASDVYKDRIELAWVDVSSVESGFLILRDSGPSTNPDTLVLTGPDVTSYTDVPPVLGTTYRYCIRSFRDSMLISAKTCDDGSCITTAGTAASIALSYKLSRKDPYTSDEYGYSIGVSRGVAIVGSWKDDDLPLNNSGSAYIFERNPDGTWSQGSKLTGSPRYTNGYFGGSVAIDGRIAIVGAYGSNANVGAAYVFERNADGTWTQTDVLLAGDGSAGDWFGCSVAISGEIAIVGARYDDASKGSAYVFERQTDAGWAFKEKLTASDGAGGDNFGFSVAIDGELALIGAFLAENQRGSAYVFRRSQTGDWTEEGVLIPRSEARSFGFSIDISGSTAIVGAYRENSDTGASYVFQRQADSTWVEEQRLTAGDGSASDYFGISVALREGVALIGASGDDDEYTNQGSAYVFGRGDDGIWTQKQKFTAGDPGSNYIFGRSVSIGVDAMLIGSPNNSAEYSNSGEAYLVEVPSPPSDISASDGSFDSKVRVTWNDVSSIEDGYHVYRDGEPIEDVPASVEVYEDFDAEPGRTYEYSVAAFSSESEASFSLERVSDLGWRPPNGNITGRISALGGGAREGIFVGLDPLPTKSLLFDGAGGHVRAADSEGDFNFAIDDDYTVEAWFKYTGAGGSGEKEGTLIAKVTPRGSGPKKYPFWLSNMRAEGDPGRLIFSASDGVKAVGVKSLSEDLNDNTWHHVACVHDAEADELQIYVDGYLEGVTPYTGLGDITNPDSLSLGSGATTGSWFGGQLDEIRIWNVKRDSTQIREAMYDRLTGEEVGLTAYWPLDEGSSGVITDPLSGMHYGKFSGGVYWSDNCAPLEIFTTTDQGGTYVLAGLRYGIETTFKVRPFEGNRQFEPPYTAITLSIDQPVQNQVNFSDISSYTLSGVIKYEATDCPAADVPIHVDGIVRGSTDKNGKFALSVDNGSHSVKPVLVGHSFTPDSLTFLVEDDIEGIDFTDLTTRTLSGSVGGGCGRRIGDVTITVRSENGCMMRSITADSAYSVSLPPQRYLVSAAVVESSIPDGLIKSDVIRFFQNLGQREADLDSADVVMDMTYRAPLKVAIEGLEAYIPTGCPGPLRFEGLELPENLPVIPQLDVFHLSIHVDENYGTEGLCPLDSGTVVIYDEISDQEGTPIELVVQNGEALYTTFACTPSLIVGRTDSEGNNRSFQKAIRAMVIVEGRTPATCEEWVVVTGHVAEEGADFVTASSNWPVSILRDPPGDRSYSYLEESRSIRMLQDDFDEWKLLGQTGVELEVETGLKQGFFFGLGAGTIQNIEVVHTSEHELFLGGLESMVDKIELTVTTKRRLSTSADQMFIGQDADVFVGAGVNYIFSKTGRVEVIDCEVIRSTGIGIEPTGINTMYAYTRRYIKDVLIPELQLKADYYEETDPDNRGRFLAMVQEWQDIVSFNDRLKNEAEIAITENRSFSGGTEFSYMCDSITTDIYTHKRSFVLDSKINLLGLAFHTTASGYVLEVPVKIHNEFVTEYEDTTKTNQRGFGYVLSDHNPGDRFTVDILGDGTYPSPVFNVLAGVSSCPYEAWPDSTGEPRVMARDKPQLFIDPPRIEDVPPDEAAVFKLILANMSPTDEPRRYVLREIATANRYGALIRANGVFINDDLVYYPNPGEALELTITVERGPTHYSYNGLGIMVYPLCEWWVYEDGGPLNLADSVFFDVTFETPCSDITLFRPEPGWVISEADSFVNLILNDYELSVDEKVLKAVGCEYRRLGSGNVGPTGWDTLFVVFPDSSLETEYEWHPDDSLPDGVYELRAFTSCLGGWVYSGVTTGTIDRHGPVVLGTPEPSDEDLSFGEDIRITFNEPVRCASTPDSCVTLKWLDGPNAGAEIALETVCDGSTIVIVPTADADLLEGRRLEAGVSAIRDIVGNVMQGTTTWIFKYSKSRFAWSDSDPSEEVPFRNPGSVTAELVNGSGVEIDFEITLIPAWIESAAPASGTIGSGETATITFDILETIAIGSYADSIFAEGVSEDDTSLAGMLLTLEVSCIPPQWSVRPGDFEHSMTMVAELDIGGTNSTDTNDRVSAWVGNQLRGVADVQSVSGLPSTHLAFLTIYGNRTQGETVRFQIWDDDDCRLYNATLERYPFAANDQIGSPHSPVTLTAIDSPVAGDSVLAIGVDEGWNWISTNILSPDMTVDGVTADLTPAPGDIVKSQSTFTQFVSDSTGWVPTLVLDNVSSYMIRLSNSGTIFHTGTTVPVDSVIPVGQGWNWIGYLPDGPMEVTEALGDLYAKGIVSTDDIIKSQDGFAQFYGSEWYGSLDSMRVGEGYKLYLVGAGDYTFNYPAYVSSPSPPVLIAAKAEERATIDGAPEWSVNPRAYQYNMTMTSVLLVEGVESADPSDIIGAFVGGECRGVANPVYVECIRRHVVFLMIYSNEAEGEEVSFRAFDADAALVYEIDESISCSADAAEGTVLDPIVLNAGAVEKEEETEIPAAFGLAQNFPNPFNPATVIHYDVPDGGGLVSIRIYDVGGRLVRTLVQGHQTPGRKSVVWHGLDNRGNSVATGAYFYQMKAPGFEETRKLILIR